MCFLKVVTVKEFIAMKVWSEILSKEFTKRGLKFSTTSQPGEIIGKDVKCDNTR